jgi:type IV conjugative transfer system coupling protein TraD
MGRKVRGTGEAWLRGAQTIGHNVAMIAEVLGALLIPVVIWAGLCVWMGNSKSPEHVQVYGLQSLQAKAFAAVGKPLPDKISIRGMDGVERTYFNTEVEHLAWIQPYARAYTHNLRIAFFIWLCGVVALACLTTLWFIQNGREKLKARFIRGQSAVPLHRLVYDIQAFNAEEVKRRELTDWQPVKLIGVPYPFGTEHEHSMTVGSPGSGKSQAIHQLLESIRQRGDRAVIYDPELEYTRYHYDADADIILNPYDARSAAWSPYNDATDLPGLEKLATCIFKEPKGGDPYWTKATRQIFTYAAYSLRRQFPSATLEDLLKVFFGPAEILSKLVEGTPAATHLAGGSNGRTDSLRSVLTEGVNSLLHLAGQEADFSLRHWVNDSSRTGGFLFMSAPETHMESLRPLLSFWSELVVSSLLGRLDEDNRPTTWIILDEFPSLGKVASLASGPERLRKYGGAVFLGMQQYSQIQEIYGPEIAQTILGQCATKLILRCQDPETAKHMSEQLGRHQTRRIDETVSYGANSLRDGVGLTPREELEPIALPDEVMNLPKFHGFIRVSNAREGSAFPISTIKFEFKARQRKAEGLVPRAGDPVDAFFANLRGAATPPPPSEPAPAGPLPPAPTELAEGVQTAAALDADGTLHDADGVVIEDPDGAAAAEGARVVEPPTDGDGFGTDASVEVIGHDPLEVDQASSEAFAQRLHTEANAQPDAYARLVEKVRRDEAMLNDGGGRKGKSKASDRTKDDAPGATEKGVEGPIAAPSEDGSMIYDPFRGQ